MTCRLVITGSAGAGKTTLLGMFNAQGVPTLSADDIVHKLLTQDHGVITAIGKQFPQVVVDNRLDRDRYLAHVFDHPHHLDQVEAILHPRVYQALLNFSAEHVTLGTPLIALEIPLYFETAPENFPVDKILVATAPHHLRQERVLARKSMTLSRFQALADRQSPDAIKKERADFVLDTSVNIKQLEQEVAPMIAFLQSLH